MKKPVISKFRWVPFKNGRSNGSINVSSKGHEKYRIFSPFSHDEKYRIPVPGEENTYSNSVEGIWQGLKVINGQTDVSSFVGRPKKRKGKPDGHLFGEVILSYVDARKQIYVPAYLYHVINNSLDSVNTDLEKRLNVGNVTLFDVESNGSIKDISKPYSHAALLVKLLNMLRESPLPPFNKKKFAYLHNQVEALLEYRSGLRNENLSLCDDVITFAYLFSPDELKSTFALRVIKEGCINDNNRLEKYMPTSKTEEPYLALRR